MTSFTYTVVENAGYEKENIREFGIVTVGNARNYIARHYDHDELDELHVEIRKDYADGTVTYEF